MLRTMWIYLWGKLEYNAWKVAAQYILDHETFDWHLNTGDISQNANRTFEWFDYFRYLGSSVKEKPHRISCG